MRVEAMSEVNIDEAMKLAETLGRQLYAAPIRDVEARALMFSDLKFLASAVRHLASENARLKDEESCYCGYCGWDSPVGKTSWDDLQVHIKSCVKHPVFTLRAALEKAEGVLNTFPCGCDWFGGTISQDRVEKPTKRICVKCAYFSAKREGVRGD